MTNLALPPTLAEQIAELYFAASDRTRRDRNRKRTGKVVEIDAEKGLARVQLNEGKGGYDPMLTGWIPWHEQAMGGNKTHFPPSEGQQVEITSESGDLADGVITSSLPSNDNPRPSTSADEYILSKVGETTIKVTGGEVIIESGTITLRANAVKVEKK